MKYPLLSFEALPRCRLTSRLQETPANIRRINLILPETRVIALYLCRWQYGSIFIQIFVVGSKKRMHFETECEMAVKSSKVISFGTNRSDATSYSSSIVTLVLSCPVSEMLHVFCSCSEQRPYPYSTWTLGCFPWTRLPMLWLQGAKTLS